MQPSENATRLKAYTRKAEGTQTDDGEYHSLYVPLPVFGGQKPVCAGFRLSQIVVICRNRRKLPNNTEKCLILSRSASIRRNPKISLFPRPDSAFWIPLVLEGHCSACSGIFFACVRPDGPSGVP
jgi:hypothetical protein